jgi:hypothetical protein
MIQGGAVGGLRSLARRVARGAHAVVKLFRNRADLFGNAHQSHFHRLLEGGRSRDRRGIATFSRGVYLAAALRSRERVRGAGFARTRPRVC